MKSSAIAVLASSLALGSVLGSTALADPPHKPNPSMKVQIDKDTGQLRNATAAEADALESATQRQLTEDWWNRTVPDTGSQVMQLANGGTAVRMTADSLEAFAIRIDEDGNAVALHTSVDAESLEEDATTEELADE